MAGTNVTRKKGGPTFGFYWLRVLRIIVATLVLLSFLAVFVDFRKQIEGWFIDGLAQTQFVPAWQSALAGIVWPSLAIFAAFIVGALLFGRVYCSFLCPFGILQDVVSWISRKFKKAKNRAYKYARPVKWVRPLVVAVIVVASLLGFGSVAWAWLDPYSQFGRFAHLLLKPAVVEGNNAIVGSMDKVSSWWYMVNPGWPHLGWALIPMLLLLAVAIVFAAMRGRLYCNTICPVGAILGFLSKFAAFRVIIDKGSCVKCAKCMKSCKSQCIDLKTVSIDHSRCVNCFDCVSVCDNKGIKYQFTWKKGKGQATPPPPKKKKTPPPSTPDDVPSEGSPVMVMLPHTDRRAFLGATALGLLTTLTSCAGRKTGGIVKSAYNPLAISPPGSGSIDDFLSSCTGCQLCVAACPGNCLEPSYMEYGAKGIFKPRMTYRRGFCQFECTTCSNVCPAGAIKPLTRDEKKVEAVGKADLRLGNCIAANDKTDCGACAEHCPTVALEMVRFTQPVLSPKDCVSCLKCKEVCPKGAITYTRENPKNPIFDYKKCIGCGRCIKVCEGNALSMHESQYNVRVPVLHAEYCIGCGGCEYICPPKTITIKGINPHEQAQVKVFEKIENPNDGMDFPF